MANKKTLTPEEEKLVRDSIYLLLSKNACIGCHATNGHKTHPEYED